MNLTILKISTYINLHGKRFLSYGFLGIAKKIFEKISIISLSIMFLPISLILFIIGIRRLNIFIDRIGHLAIEPDTLLKAQALGLIKAKRWFILAPNNRAANQHLLSYWRPFFYIFSSKIICFFLYCLSIWPFMRYDVSHFVNNKKGEQLAYRVNALWKKRSPILCLTEEDKKWGNEQLQLLGLPPNNWFICIHAREGGFSPVDEILHKHRNSDICNLIPSIQEITRRGGWVIRLGDPTMKPLPTLPQVIDYAHHILRSARLDIILCARAKFILGNTSGIFLVASIFGVPSALANMIPFTMLGMLPKDISIPKLYLSSNNKEISFKNIMTSPIANLRNGNLFGQYQFNIKENSPEDILLLTVEMIEKLNNNFSLSLEDIKRIEKFKFLFKAGHYSYGSASTISVLFLKRYQHLL